MNGLATFKHSSGYYYEGLFSNGIPNKLESATLNIFVDNECLDADDKFKIVEGSLIPRITVKCLNEEHEPLMEDGRVIQLTLAIKIDITDTASYENQIQTEFGFSVVPVSLLSNNTIQIKEESTIIEEGINEKSSNIINELTEQTTTNDTTMIELDQILGSKTKPDETSSNNIATSYSSKPAEVAQQNEAGITHFDGLYVENVPFPRKIQSDSQKPAKVRIIHKGSASSNSASSSKHTIQTRESTFLLDNSTCN